MVHVGDLPLGAAAADDLDLVLRTARLHAPLTIPAAVVCRTSSLISARSMANCCLIRVCASLTIPATNSVMVDWNAGSLVILSEHNWVSLAHSVGLREAQTGIAATTGTTSRPRSAKASMIGSR